jgi:DNA-binding MarR family transcriptional regulator
VVEAIALGAVNALWPEAWLFVALRDPRNRGGAKVQEMTDAEARRYVQLVFTKATEYVASHPLVSGRTEVDQAISTVLDRRKDGCWSGVAGATDHTVLGAHLAVARSAGSIEYSASDRQLAEVAGVRHDTVSRSNGRLIKGGWIHRVRVGKGSKASGWRVRVSEDDDRQDQATKDLPYGGVRFSGLILLAGRDAFRSRALGKNGLRVLEALAVETATASKLAKELKLDPSTVRRALNGLQDVGLVGLNTDRIWHVVSTDPTDLDLAAAWFGTAGRGERQRNEHNRDRESYLDDRLRRLANRTGSPKARSDQAPRSTARQTAADWKSA